MASEALESYNSPSTIILELYPNQDSPTNSGEEAKKRRRRARTLLRTSFFGTRRLHRQARQREPWPLCEGLACGSRIGSPRSSPRRGKRGSKSLPPWTRTEKLPKKAELGSAPGSRESHFPAAF